MLIVVFTFFYAFVQVNPEKVAENLQKSSGYILSVRPGKDTESICFRYFTTIGVQLGALYLGGISILLWWLQHYGTYHEGFRCLVVQTF